MMMIAMKSAACFGEAQVRGACQSIKSVFITAFVIQIIILKKIVKEIIILIYCRQVLEV